MTGSYRLCDEDLCLGGEEEEEEEEEIEQQYF